MADLERGEAMSVPARNAPVVPRKARLFTVVVIMKFLKKVRETNHL
jgi:hypothetical protein